MKPQEILFYFTYLHHGNWDKIYDSILKKEPIDESKLAEFQKNNHYSYITLLDKDFPECLKNIEMPPYVIFYQGDLNLLKEGKRVAVIGTRKMSEYGAKVTKDFVQDLVNEDYIIVSGLARGVDGKAHQVCLEEQGKAIAVIGNGLDVVYPTCNKDIYEGVSKTGLIITEYPEGTPAEPNNFRLRNRLVAGAADIVLVMEAFARSGTLITVKYALEQGKDIYCVPDRLGRGSICNKLIKELGCLIESVSDIDKKY